MRHFSKRGFSLTEFIVTMAVLGIITAVTAGVLVTVLSLFIYLPREMKAKTIAHEAIELVTEGEIEKRGARYAVEIEDASSDQFTYTFGYPGNADKRRMRFRWDGVSRLYRSYTAFGTLTNSPQPPYSTEEAVPYYAGGDISIKKRSGSQNIFTYYTASGSQLSSPVPQGQLSTIRRVEINMLVTTGSGLFSLGEGSVDTTSSVEVRQYI